MLKKNVQRIDSTLIDKLDQCFEDSILLETCSIVNKKQFLVVYKKAHFQNNVKIGNMPLGFTTI